MDDMSKFIEWLAEHGYRLYEKNFVSPRDSSTTREVLTEVNMRDIPPLERLYRYGPEHKRYFIESQFSSEDWIPVMNNDGLEEYDEYEYAESRRKRLRVCHPDLKYRLVDTYASVSPHVSTVTKG